MAYKKIPLPAYCPDQTSGSTIYNILGLRDDGNEGKKNNGYVKDIDVFPENDEYAPFTLESSVSNINKFYLLNRRLFMRTSSGLYEFSTNPAPADPNNLTPDDLERKFYTINTHSTLSSLPDEESFPFIWNEDVYVIFKTSHKIVKLNKSSGQGGTIIGEGTEAHEVGDPNFPNGQSNLNHALTQNNVGVADEINKVIVFQNRCFIFIENSIIWSDANKIEQWSIIGSNDRATNAGFEHIQDGDVLDVITQGYEMFIFTRNTLLGFFATDFDDSFRILKVAENIDYYGGGISAQGITYYISGNGVKIATQGGVKSLSEKINQVQIDNLDRDYTKNNIEATFHNNNVIMDSE